MKGRANIKKRAKQKLRYLKILKRLKETKKAPALSRGLIQDPNSPKGLIGIIAQQQP